MKHFARSLWLAGLLTLCLCLTLTARDGGGTEADTKAEGLRATGREAESFRTEADTDVGRFSDVAVEASGLAGRGSFETIREIDGVERKLVDGFGDAGSKSLRGRGDSGEKSLGGQAEHKREKSETERKEGARRSSNNTDNGDDTEIATIKNNFIIS